MRSMLRLVSKRLEGGVLGGWGGIGNRAIGLVAWVDVKSDIGHFE